MDGLNVVVGLFMLVGLIGIAVPLLPGLLLIWTSVLVWAAEAHATTGWVVLGVATALAVSGALLQYLLPGRLLAKAGVRTSSTVLGTALGVVGFFVVPVVGAFLGFVLGVYLAERVTQGSHAATWSSTKHAVKAVGLSMGVELMTGLAIVGTWMIGVMSLT